MLQTQQRFQDTHQGTTGAAFFCFGALIIKQDRFGKLQVPVTVLMPGKFIECLGHEVEAVAFYVAGNFILDLLQTRNNPSICQRQDRVILRIKAGVFILALHEYIAGGIPQLVAVVAITLKTVRIKLDVATGGGQGSKGEP